MAEPDSFDPQNIDYRYHAQVEDVVDADTYDMRLWLFQGIETTVRVRHATLDTHEIFGVPKESDEYQRGIAEREFVVNWLTEAARDAGGTAWPVTVVTEQDNTGKFGRTLGHVYRKSDGESLEAALLEEFPDLAETQSVQSIEEG